jgi:hypothetical protein
MISAGVESPIRSVRMAVYIRLMQLPIAGKSLNRASNEYLGLDRRWGLLKQWCCQSIARSSLLTMAWKLTRDPNDRWRGPRRFQSNSPRQLCRRFVCSLS